MKPPRVDADVRTLSLGWILIAALLTGIGSATAAPATLSPPARQIDRYLREQMAAREFSGAALVARNGRIVFSGGYGFADRRSGRKNTARTLFRLAGWTMFNDIAVRQLHDRGRLTLEDSVCRFVSSCPGGWKPITIAALREGKSGLPDLWRLRARSNVRPTIAGAVRWMKSQPLVFPPSRPGRRRDDSPAPQVLLAYVIGRAAGSDWVSYVRRAILMPARMTSTFLTAEAPSDRRAIGYVLPSFRVGRDREFTRPDPVSGTWTTVGDLLRLDQAIYGGVLLTRTSREELFPSGVHTVHGLHGYDRPQGHVVDGWYEIFAHHAPDRVFVALLMNGRKPSYRFYEIELKLAWFALGGPLRRARPVALPSGQLIAVSGNLGVVTVTTADGKQQAALTLPYAGRGWPAGWSSDGERLAFSRCAGNECRAFVIDANGLHEHAVGKGFATGWTPDGRIVVADEAISFLSIDGRSRTRPTQAALRRRSAGTLAYSPDGDRVLYTTAVSPRGAQGRTVLMILDTHTGETRRLGTEPGYYAVSSQAWSPDGEQIAFLRKRSLGSFEGGAYVADADGSDVRLLDSAAGRAPVWSPDGTTVAYNLGISCQLRLRNVDTRDRSDVTTEACAPVWRPR